MIGESLAITALILVMSVIFARRGRRLFAAYVLPLISVPMFHFIGWITPPQGQWVKAFDIAGLAVGILLCAVFSRAFTSNLSRAGYLVFCCVFMIALTVAYLINLY